MRIMVKEKSDVIGHLSTFTMTGVVMAQGGGKLMVSVANGDMNTIYFPDQSEKVQIGHQSSPVGLKIYVRGEIHQNKLIASEIVSFEPDGGNMGIWTKWM